MTFCKGAAGASGSVLRDANGELAGLSYRFVLRVPHNKVRAPDS